MPIMASNSYYDTFNSAFSFFVSLIINTVGMGKITAKYKKKRKKRMLKGVKRRGE